MRAGPAAPRAACALALLCALALPALAVDPILEPPPAPPSAAVEAPRKPKEPIRTRKPAPAAPSRDVERPTPAPSGKGPRSIFDYKEEIGLSESQVSRIRGNLEKLSSYITECGQRLARNDRNALDILAQGGVQLSARTDRKDLDALYAAAAAAVRRGAAEGKGADQLTADSESFLPGILSAAIARIRRTSSSVPEATIEKVEPFLAASIRIKLALSVADAVCARSVDEAMTDSQRARWRDIQARAR